MSFLCEYGLLLEKPLAMSVREVIWAVSFDSLLKPNPYVDVAWAANEVMPCGAKKESSTILEENPLLILPFYIIIIVLIFYLIIK